MVETTADKRLQAVGNEQVISKISSVILHKLRGCHFVLVNSNELKVSSPTREIGRIQQSFEKTSLLSMVFADSRRDIRTKRVLCDLPESERGSEGHAVVAADVGGQAALFKKPLKHSESVIFFGGRERFAVQQVPAGVVGDRERIAVLTITEQEFALVIGAPKLVGTLA